jgi:hypothetical protein
MHERPQRPVLPTAATVGDAAMWLDQMLAGCKAD